MTKELSADTIMYTHVMALTNATLTHNATVVQLASEVIAAGPVYKTHQMRRIRDNFNRVHKDYQKEYQRVMDALETELKKAEERDRER